MSALDVALAMITNCGTVQELLGVDGEIDPAAAALALCVADDAGEFDWIEDDDYGTGIAADGSALPLEPPMLICLEQPEDPEMLDAPAQQAYRGSGAYHLLIAAPDAADYAGSTITRWARGKLEAIETEWLAQVGGPSNAFARATIGKQRPFTKEQDAGPFAGSWVLPLVYEWE